MRWIFALRGLQTAFGFACSLLPLADAATTDGALRMEVVTAYNFVVDSNVETPAGKSPSAAHLGVKIYNDGPVVLTDVAVRIGDLLDPATSAGTLAVFPSRTVTVSGSGGYSGTFALQMPGGAADAVRHVQCIEPGTSVTQYFFVTYPLKDGAGNSVAGAAPDPSDDLWLHYDIWASAREGLDTRRVDQTNTVTMRNEISAMANKIWPNTSSKVPDRYLDAIEASLGWRPDSENPRLGTGVRLEGIWYDLGNVGAGFDNNGDGVPDRNAWMQPVGDPSQFDPLATRLVKCYGLVVVKLNDGTEKLIPFEDRLYFENLPANNTGAVGLVYYEFLPLAAVGPTTLSPYQEVASGYDNEKFNADYGSSGGSFTTAAPEVAVDKNGPSVVAGGDTATYTITATNNGSVGIGFPLLSLPFTFEDSVPDGLVYVAGSATAANVLPPGQTVQAFWSTDDGASWLESEPLAASVTTIRWSLGSALAAGTSATVSFQASVPTTYPQAVIDNTAVIKLGPVGELARDKHRTLVTGINSIGDLVWKDDDRDSAKDAGESGLANVGVTLYFDANSDGILDSGDLLYATTQTNASGIYTFANLPDGRFLVVVDIADADLPAGYSLPNSATEMIGVDLDSARTNVNPVAVLTADWPFIGALEVVKNVTPTTYGEGDLITYTIDLENHSAAVAPKSIPVQSAWAATVTGNRSQQNATNAQGSPDSVYARIDWAANADNLAASGFTYPDPNGGITKVELIFNGYLLSALTNDTVEVQVNGSLFTTLSATQLNTLVGPAKEYAINITSLNASWTWAQVQALTSNLLAKKLSSADGPILWIDGIGFRVTTDAAPPPVGTYGPATFDPLPLVDSYDATKLQYVSASVAPSSVVAGTITWGNLGPLNAGARKTITVTFRALTPPDTNGNGEPDTTTHLNTASSSSAKFVSGRPVNPDSSTATVTIQPRGEIGDLVFWDINGNSIRETGEPGLANVLVTLSNGAQTRTDVNGYYLFPSLIDGTYTVTVETTTLPWTTFNQTKDPDATVNSASTVTINNNDGNPANDFYLDRDFGYDSTLNVISGTLFTDNDGDGTLDPAEAYLTGTTVTLLRDADSNGSYETTVTTATTNASGFYQFSSLPNGLYQVVASQPAGTTQTLDPDLPPGNTTGDNATNENASGGNLYPNNNFAYRPTGTLALGDTLYLDWNGDGGQGPGEDGIANVDVFLYEDANGNGLVDPAEDALVATSVTNATGTYGFTNLPAGNWIVIVNTADPQFPASVTQTQDFDGTRDNRAVVNLSTTRLDLDFGYQPQGSGRIGDTVFIDLDGDGLADPGEPGIAGVTVALYEDTDNNGTIDANDALVASAVTGTNGLYLFTGLPAGNYLVDVDQNAAAIPEDSLGNTYRRTNSDPRDVTLAAGQSVLTADFGFAAPVSIGDFVFFDANANGTQDWSETGIPGVTVELYQDADRNGSPDSGTPLATTATTDGSGAEPAGFYQFGNLPAGTYYVRVLTSTLPQSGGQPIPQTADPDRDGVPVGDNTYPGLPPGDHADALITLALGSNYSGADFGYKAPGSIGDFVWLDLDQDGVQDAGEPGVAGVTVRVSNGSTTVDAVTDFDGYWSVANLSDGTWTVSVPASNFSMGAPLENTAATYDADGGSNSSVQIVLAGGNVDLPVGNLGLDFGYKLDGSFGISGTVAIHDTGVIGTADDIDDFFDDGTDQDAGPSDETELAGLTVYLTTAAGDLLGSTVTDAGGNYSFSGLPAGDYRVILGTTAAPLDRATLTTTAANHPAVTSVTTPNGTSVIQTLTLSSTSVTNVDFTFLSNVAFDFGDLPSSYGMTTLAQDGARHVQPTGGYTRWLGSVPDTDTNGIADALASGDDTFGGDEDGIELVAPATWADGSFAGGDGGSIDVNVHGGGWLVAWIDWNQDGDFLDAGEFVADQAVAGGATTTLEFDIPAGTIQATSQSWLSRFRLFAARPAFPLFSYKGEATDGEVEDHLLEKPLGSSIGDIVWIDSDGDGVLDASESGLAGRIVELRDGSNTPIDSQITGDGTQDVDGDGVIDPVGFYRFRGLSAGPYTVTVSNPPAGYDPSYDEDGIASASAATLVLGNDEQHLTADFGYKPKSASISGQVRRDLDADGELGDPDPAIAFVKIQLWTDPNGDGDPSDGVQVGETYTDSNGNYLFSGIPTGSYVVTETNLPGSTSTGDADGGNPDRIAVTLVGGDITDRDFLDTTPPLYSISGAVYDDNDGSNDNLIGIDDTPVPMVWIELFFDRDGSNSVTAGDTLFASTWTTAAGTYQFQGLPPGNYVVRETDPSGATSEWDAQGAPADNQIAVGVVNANITARDFLDDGTPLGSLGDRVWVDYNGNAAQDNNEPGLPGITVFIDSDMDGVFDAGEPSAITGTNGIYQISNLPAGAYQVRVDAAALSAYTTPTHDLDGVTTPHVASVLVGAGGVRNDVDFGYRGDAAITGTVFADTDNDDDGDAPLGGVTLTLQDSGGNTMATTTTAPDGSYSFAGLVPGAYRVVETQPSGYLSVTDKDGGNPNEIEAISVIAGQTNTGNDFIEEQPGVIGDYVWNDADRDGVQDEDPAFGANGVTVELLDGTGAVVATTTTANDGSGNPGYYQFGNLSPGTYSVRFSAPAGQVFTVQNGAPSAADNSDADRASGETAQVTLAGGGNITWLDAGLKCPDTWADWKLLHPSETAAGNPDADAYDNFAEFAFAMPYESGVPSQWLPAGTAWIIRPSTIAPGTLEGVFIRPEGAPLNVTYTLQYAAVPGSPATDWDELVIDLQNATWVSNGDCTETVTIHDLAGLTGLPDGGIARIKAQLDEVPGSGTDHASDTETGGWKNTALELCCRTYNNPFQQETVLTGSVAAVSGQGLIFSGESLAGLLIPGVPYYLEVTSGDLEGHRFDIVSAGGDTVVLASDADLHAPDAPFSTLAGAPPADLAGGTIAIHRHRTLAGMFAPLVYGSAPDRAAADQIKLLAAGQWSHYWLYDGVATGVAPRWVKAGDNTYADQGGLIIAPGQGLFFDNHKAATTILAYGEVRANKFIRPLAQGTSLVGGGYPLDQSAAGANSRQMTPAGGFYGSRDLATADTFYIWKGDAAAAAVGYDSYFLNVAGTNPAKWVKIGDAALLSRNAEILLLGDRGVILREKNPVDTYTIPTPWAP